MFAFTYDGFVAATPLGSTAYALSAAGPVISGDARCYALVAVAPHSLVSRPLIVGEEQIAQLKVGEAGALFSVVRHRELLRAPREAR